MKDPAPVKDPAKDIARSCLGVRARLVSRAVSGLFDDALRPHGLTAAQLNILVVIAVAGRASPTLISRILVMERSTVSRNVERMRRKGWIQAVPGRDRRARVLRLTAKGRRLLADAYDGWKRANEAASRLLGAEGGHLLTQIASRLTEGRL